MPGHAAFFRGRDGLPLDGKGRASVG
jgi:hypothetical protein